MKDKNVVVWLGIFIVVVIAFLCVIYLNIKEQRAREYDIVKQAVADILQEKDINGSNVLQRALYNSDLQVNIVTN